MSAHFGKGFWLVAAGITCPCHWALVALVAGGTALGGWLVSYWPMVAAAATGLFLLSLYMLTRPVSREEHDSRREGIGDAG